VGTTRASDWAEAAELTISEASEVMNLSLIDCCAVAAEHCPGEQTCNQCWDATLAPRFNAEWTGDGFPWLDMAIAPTSGEFKKVGFSARPEFEQYVLLEFGEVCVAGNIGPIGEAPTRVVDVCRTLTSSRLGEAEGRTRVDVESCLAAPDVEEGTRGLLVLRAATEAEARSRVESSPYVVGADFVPMAPAQPTASVAPINAANSGTAAVAEPAASTAGTAASAAGAPGAAAVGTATDADLVTADSTGPPRPVSSGCSTVARGTTVSGWWLWLLLAVVRARRGRRTAGV
jgi:hypothetical protein